MASARELVDKLKTGHEGGKIDLTFTFLGCNSVSYSVFEAGPWDPKVTCLLLGDSTPTGLYLPHPHPHPPPRRERMTFDPSSWLQQLNKSLRADCCESVLCCLYMLAWSQVMIPERGKELDGQKRHVLRWGGGAKTKKLCAFWGEKIRAELLHFPLLCHVACRRF